MKVCVLGDGVTAAAVIKEAPSLGYAIVPLSEADIVVSSPGIPRENLPSTTVPIISEIEFAFKFLNTSNTPLIAVTGTNGKTSVVSLISHLLNVPSYGNIGVPFISAISNQGISHFVVEVSSFQLELCKLFKPTISVLLNITPDHLERHKSMSEYVKHKAAICVNQTPDNYFLFNPNDSYAMEISQQTAAKSQPVIVSSTILSYCKQRAVLGQHNYENIAAAVQVAQLMGMDNDKIYDRLSTFVFPEHRLEYMGLFAGVSFYNDSKATNPDAVIKAVDAMADKPHLILCGEDKSLDLKPLISYLHKHTKSITVFGDMADLIVSQSKFIDTSFDCNAVTDLDSCLKFLKERVLSGEIVLFSPSSSSYDMFKGFADRGRNFKTLVQRVFDV